MLGEASSDADENRVRILYILTLFLFSNMKKNKLPQIKRRFSRIDLFSKKECAGGT